MVNLRARLVSAPDSSRSIHLLAARCMKRRGPSHSTCVAHRRFCENGARPSRETVTGGACYALLPSGREGHAPLDGDNMFGGFRTNTLDTGEAHIRVRHKGSGPPLLLLHGHPQTHLMWHRVAPRLAEDFTVVCADLRGYGDSGKPLTTQDHEPYSKRAMARDMVKVMQRLGFDAFFLAGHDRGGRCAYRLALDHPGHVLKLAVLDIVPTAEMWRRADMAFGMTDRHWLKGAARALPGGRHRGGP